LKNSNCCEHQRQSSANRPKLKHSGGKEQTAQRDAVDRQKNAEEEEKEPHPRHRKPLHGSTHTGQTKPKQPTARWQACPKGDREEPKHPVGCETSNNRQTTQPPKYEAVQTRPNKQSDEDEK
jgi:hypothetical protein